jgi:hypothetical protein
MTHISSSVFQLDQFDSLPSKPGLYCWMALPNFNRYSWELQKDESQADRTDCLLDELTTFCRSSGLQPVHAAVTAFFDSSWSGKIEYSSNRKVEAGFSRALKSACKTDEERRLLVDLISQSFPIFWQPLYVGVASNLKSRLSTHKRIFGGSKVDETPATTGEKEDLESAKNLGERLLACSYRPEYLRVYTLAVEHSGIAIDEQRTRRIAEVAESWLNILNTPKLGRA